MKFSNQLFEKVKPIWDQNHAHPFVQEIGSGTLATEKFRFYMVQDYLYLIDFAKLFALATVKTNDVELMRKFAHLLESTLNEEMSLHRQYASRFGITSEELENAAASPTTLAYSHYMLHIAQNGSLAELVSALLPCMWSYWEIGKDLRTKNPESQNHEFFGEWIKMYSSDEFGSLALWLINLLDELAEGKSGKEIARLEEIFLTTSKFEYMFWDTAYKQETWPSYE
ncbi:thiaminase II [Bacillus sp. Marseille-P3661]|uniref:thiaminase II n=1 Tax=Bacillus sp. Marseille-P3661 TaxID=1936234 RepID=UPI000C852B67|nr:thiaminase II [Bacillus sp. Marseille-P3661]